MTIDLDQQRRYVLGEARKAYRRLKRRGLIMDVHITPDRSAEIVAILGCLAYDVHAKLSGWRAASSSPTPHKENSK